MENPLNHGKKENNKKRGLLRAVALATAITAGPFIFKKDEGTPPPPDLGNQTKKELVVGPEEAPTEEKIIISRPSTPEEKATEAIRQQKYHERYVAIHPSKYGERLYFNEELISPDSFPSNPKLVEEVRLLQYFLRNGREKTFAAAKQLGSEYRQTKLGSNDLITQIFKEAGIDIEGEIIEWIEVPNGRSGGVYRDGKSYGGKNESIVTVRKYEEEPDDWAMIHAQKAGYAVDTKKSFDGVVANEMSHEIQYRYFSSLFTADDSNKLDEPFKSFETDIPKLRFQNNAQAAEFLSDFVDWNVAGPKGAHFRFFNPLSYMTATSEFSTKDRYWFSYQVQQYAMEQVLEKKGYKNSKAIVQNLIDQARSLDHEKQDELFISARKYFQEKDFEEIANIYRRIGVELLSRMRPYFKHPSQK